jgi:hypothetical protein
VDPWTLLSSLETPRRRFAVLGIRSRVIHSNQNCQCRIVHYSIEYRAFEIFSFLEVFYFKKGSLAILSQPLNGKETPYSIT